ncbi:MAG: TRAP transporter small permease [Kiloniellales bacterium]|nr:TRAP transporter small permease [Kiloniellales bacterium]
MWQALDRGLNRVYTACGVIGAGFLFFLMVLVLASIGTRAAGIYVGGLTEYSGYAMAAASYFALSYTFRDGAHIRVTMVLTRFHGAARYRLELFCLAVASFFALYLAYYMVELAYISWDFEERSEGGDAMLLWIPQSGAAAGSIVMAVCVLHAFIKTLAGGDFFRAPDGDATMME